MEKSKKQSIKFVFMFVAKSVCGDVRRIAKSTPKNTEYSDGDLVYYWETKGRYLEAAVDRAINRCAQIRGFGDGSIDWLFDDEFDIETNGRKNTESFHDHDSLGEKLHSLDLW